MKKILFIFALAALLSACDTSTTTNDISPTDTPTPTPITWQDIHTENGTGNARSETFTVPNTWKIKWSCDPASDKYGTYNFIVYKRKVPYNGDTTIPDADVNSICYTGSTSGETEESGAGSYYLEINVKDSWSITIQKPK
jgi:hypothetical protein